MLKAGPPVLDEEVERIESHVSLKAKRGVDRCIDALARRDGNKFAMDMMPRITLVGKLQA